MGEPLLEMRTREAVGASWLVQDALFYLLLSSADRQKGQKWFWVRVRKPVWFRGKGLERRFKDH
jgi:hypothetical protein